MSLWFQQRYRHVADALLSAHGLRVPTATRNNVASIIAQYRGLPKPEGRPRGSRSALPALRVARTHARRLIEYASHPPVRKTSEPLRCAKLAQAIRRNEALTGLNLVLAGIDVRALLDGLDTGHCDRLVLRRLVKMVDTLEAEPRSIGRPWAPHRVIVNTACIAWERAGRRIGYRWHPDDGKLSGPLPDFLRELIACCSGTHAMIEEMENPKEKDGQPLRRAPRGYADPRPTSQGNVLRKRTPDSALRDAIRAWQKWRRKSPKISNLFLLDAIRST